MTPLVCTLLRGSFSHVAHAFGFVCRLGLGRGGGRRQSTGLTREREEDFAGSLFDKPPESPSNSRSSGRIPVSCLLQDIAKVDIGNMLQQSEV